LKNLSFFTRTALDGVFDSTYTRMAEGRWYNDTHAVRLQEIDNFGEAIQHKLPPDRGHGYIWRMTNLSRMEERDDGVYVEEEIMALSREVPAAIWWMARPIVRRVAKATAASSIEKTRTAVQSRSMTSVMKISNFVVAPRSD
jgi:hypothetical protein